MRILPLLLLAFAAAARADDLGRWLFLPLEGQLAGDVAMPGLAAAPAIHCTVVSSATRGASRHAVLRVEGNGTKAAIEADLDLVQQTGTWKLTDGTFDLALWKTPLARWLPDALKTVSITGQLNVTGAGVYDRDGLRGELKIVLRDATLRDTSGGWKLEGVTLEGRFALDATTASVRSAAPLTLTIRTITTSRFGARNLVVDGELKDPKTFALSSARVEIAGGDVSAAPCTIDLAPLRIAADLTVNHIGLQDVAALVPNALSKAHGRVDGVARVSWSQAQGFQLGKGHLILRRDEPAEVTLRPFPGLFTAHLSRAAQWLLPGLKKAELGQVPIEAESLDVTFSPVPDAEGRTAVIHLTGMPKDERRTPIDLETNVHGPLQTFIDLGTARNLSLGVGVH